MAMMDRIVIVDGYVDEPTCLGVPPYISTYPRYIAGAIWSHSANTEVVYHTIDQVRLSREKAFETWTSADMIMLVAGMIVPGKYIGGTPISVREAQHFFSHGRLEDIPKLLVGPWGRHGCGLEGGRLALSSDVLSPPFDYIVSGDPEVVIGHLADREWRLGSVDLEAVRESSSEIEGYAVRGAHLVKQHPGYSSGHLICEIETYRGCPRFISGGCSFCIEPLSGKPEERNPTGIIKEVEALYSQGVKAFRIGRQADLFTYGSDEMGEEEYPIPNPTAIENLFSKIRYVAPNLEVLHIDNVNPGTIARHVEESKLVARAIIKYHTTGDVAALGVESVDPEVIRRNNLKATEEEALTAVRVLNEVGGDRPAWGLPHLLPGINLVYGLDGETRQTPEYNMAFLQKIVDEGLMLRRINIRQVISYPGTRLVEKQKTRLKRHEFISHKNAIRERIDKTMIKRVVPEGTILGTVFFERHDGKSSLLRQLGSYPLLCHMASSEDHFVTTDVFVVDHGPRSLTVLPYPLNPSSATLAQLKRIPGLGAKRAGRIKAGGPYHSIKELEEVLEMDLPTWMEHVLTFS
jgi:radical SAM superfamily enzyme with C-terminal helix-hairpin-helix motif